MLLTYCFPITHCDIDLQDVEIVVASYRTATAELQDIVYFAFISRRVSEYQDLCFQSALADLISVRRLGTR